MKRVGLRLLILSVVVIVQSCVNIGPQVEADGENVTEVRELPDPRGYSAIHIMGPFNIVLFDGTGIRTNMGDAFLERVNLTVEDSTLKIIPSPRFFPFPSDRLIVYLGVRQLQELRLQVDGQLFTDGILRGDSLSLTFGGTVGGILNTDIQDLTIISESSGRIVLVGTARTLTTRILGGATLSLRNFRYERSEFNNEFGSQVLMPR